MPLLWLSLVFIAGILTAALVHLHAGVWLGVASFCMALLLLSRVKHQTISGQRFLLIRGLISWLGELWQKLKAPVPFLALLAAMALGAARYQWVQPELQDPSFIGAYVGKDEDVTVVGWIAEPPDVRDSYMNLRIHSESILLEGDSKDRRVHGLLLVQTPPVSDWHYGERLRLRGQLEVPPEGEQFSYREYLARQGIYAFMPRPSIHPLGQVDGSLALRLLYRLRNHLLLVTTRLFPDPEASLISGILLGVETGIPAAVQRAFQFTGTAHIIAISGFNITILAGLFTWVFSRLFGRWRGAVISSFLIALYTVMVGASAAAIRAAIMGILSVFARQVGRRQEGLNSLALASALMCLQNPQVPWDVGFQLSLSAMLGLVLYAESFTRAFTRLAARFIPASYLQLATRLVGEYFLFTLAAQLTVLPVISYHFRQISLISLLANPLILPAQPPLMILSGLSVLLGALFLPVGRLLAACAWPFAAFTIRAVEWLAGFPGGVVHLGEFSLVWVIVFYGLLLGITFFRQQISSRLPVIRPGLIAGGLLILNIIAWRQVLALPDGRLHVTLLETSTGSASGEALLLRTPAGRYILVNGGASPSKLSDALGRRLPMFNRQIDTLVIAGSGDGQLQALPPVLERFSPNSVLWAGEAASSRSARQLRRRFAELSVRTERLKQGQALDLGQGAELQFIGVGRRGAVMLLSMGKFRLLLPISLDFDMLDAWDYGKLIGPVNALLLADSGYAPLNPPEWIHNLQPAVVLLSVAAGDAQGLPDPLVLTAVQDYSLLRTDRNGWIELTTDGEQMWIEVERK